MKMNIRETIENREKSYLNPKGACFKSERGRAIFENPDEVRTSFMVDRDRIIHSKSFRRLKHKTQVYIRTFGDHYRTRLTHTLEVAQIGKTIGKGLGLNEDLIEAIALGHDIGHVAFAHNGEEVLNELLPSGFRHNENSVRVLTKIEKNGAGLNLTGEVLDGILYHSGFSKEGLRSSTLEGQVVRYSDKIAYVNHDIDDSIRAGLLKDSEIPKEVLEDMGFSHGERIGKLVRDCIINSTEKIENGEKIIALSSKMENSLGNLRDFMFEKIYKGTILKVERDKAKFVLKEVFNYFLNNPSKMPSLYRKISEEEGIYQGVADYISGMSDDYCLFLFNEIYVPKYVLY